MRVAASSQYRLDWAHSSDNDEGTLWDTAVVQCILLQEIRDELKGISFLLLPPGKPPARSARTRKVRA